ncbi:MAG: AEC family transporter [Melioribacteraceae bacterium]|nr:AEC family transporter [Melioribacteraceae bacterium]
MENIVFLFNIVLPIFLLILLGVLLKRINIISDVFVKQLATFVFNVSLPALIFLELASVEIDTAFDTKLIVIVILLILFVFGISWLTANIFTKTPKDKGAFIQGSYRSNYAIVGIAMLTGIVDSDHLGKAVMLLAFVMPIFNVLAVIALTVPMNQASSGSIIKTLKEIGKNPLIIAAYFAIPVSIFEINLPSPITITLEYLSDIALPLALIGIGASIDLKKLLTASRLAFIASANKIILFPIISVIAGSLFGLKDQDIIILFILMGTPTAVASFVMAEAMGSNSKMTGNIIAITTLGSIITISVGVIILGMLGVKF